MYQIQFQGNFFKYRFINIIFMEWSTYKKQDIGNVHVILWHIPPNVYIGSALLTAWYHFTQGQKPIQLEPSWYMQTYRWMGRYYKVSSFCKYVTVPNESMHVELLFTERRIHIIHKKIFSFVFYLTFVTTAKIKQHEARHLNIHEHGTLMQWLWQWEGEERERERERAEKEEEGLWEKSILVSLCPPQISHSPCQNQYCATAVRSCRLTTCTMTHSRLFWGNHCDQHIFNALKNVAASLTRPEYEVHWK
jgi:hypothetical protein